MSTRPLLWPEGPPPRPRPPVDRVGQLSNWVCALLGLLVFLAGFSIVLAVFVFGGKSGSGKAGPVGSPGPQPSPIPGTRGPAGTPGIQPSPIPGSPGPAGPAGSSSPALAAPTRNVSFTLDQLWSGNLLLAEDRRPSVEGSQYLRPGGHDVASYMSTAYMGSFFSHNNRTFMATPYHALRTDQEDFMHINEFQTNNAEVLSFIGGSTLSILANKNTSLTRMSDTWGFSFAEPYTRDMYIGATDGLAQYIANKAYDHMHHYPIIGTNQDHFIAEFSDPKSLTFARTIIPSPFQEKRAWSDQKTYQVTKLHVADVEETLAMGRFVEFTDGKFVRVLTVEPHPGDPENPTVKIIRVQTQDLFFGEETDVHGTMWVVEVLAQHGAAYLIQEGPGAIQVVNMSRLYEGLDPVLTYQYHSVGVVPQPNISFNPISFPFTGAHNLYVDLTSATLWVLGVNGVSGVYVFDLLADPYHPTLKHHIWTTLNGGRSRSYVHDMDSRWYTVEEQASILQLPEHLITGPLHLGFLAEESHYSLVNLTDLPLGEVNLTALDRVLSIRQIRAGGGYYHAGSWSPDGRYVFVSDESQPEIRRFYGRVPVFRTIWRDGRLDLVEQQALKAPWDTNVHNVYTRDMRRVHPPYVDQCGEALEQVHRRRHLDGGVAEPIPFEGRCSYEPNEYFASQPVHYYVTASMYTGGLQVFEVTYIPPKQDSNEPWSDGLEWKLIAEVSATKWFTQLYGGEWSHYSFCPWEAPADECTVGGNGIDSYRLVGYVAGLEGNLRHPKSWADPFEDDFVLLSSTQRRPIVQRTNDDDDTRVEPLAPGATRTIWYLSNELDYVQTSIILVTLDKVLDIALWRVMALTDLPFAPPLAPVDSDIDYLFSRIDHRWVNTTNAAIVSDYDVIYHNFIAEPTPGDQFDFGVRHRRRSEIVVGDIPAYRGKSGTGFIDAQGRYVGMLRDSKQGSFGLVDVRNLAHTLDKELVTVETNVNGFYSLWQARLDGIQTDPNDKIMVLAINPRTQRAFTCVTGSGSPYFFMTIDGAGDTLDVEDGRPTILRAVQFSATLVYAQMGGQVYSTSTYSPTDVEGHGIVSGNGWRCGGCKLPISGGNVANLLPYEELHGIYAGGGPKIVFLGLAGQTIYNGGLVDMIWFEVIPQSEETEGGPQFGGFFTDSPISRRTVHPPNAGDVLTGQDSGEQITVANGFVMTTVNCPIWQESDNAIPSMWPKTSSDLRLVVPFWPLRSPPISTTAFNLRSSGQTVFLPNYTLPFGWLSLDETGISGAGMIGVILEQDIDEWVIVANVLKHIEDQFAPANRIRAGDYIRRLVYNGKTCFADAQNVFGCIARIPVGAEYQARLFRSGVGTVIVTRTMLPRLGNNQMTLE